MSQSVIGALRVNLGLDSAQFARGAKKAQTTAQKLGKGLQKVGAAASVVGAGVTLAVRRQLNAFDDLAKTSQRIGVPVDALSELRHAANLSGASIEGLQRGLRNTSREMVNNADKFEEIGVAVQNADGSMRDVTSVFEDAADVLSQMEDGADKTALAMKLFGERAGPELIPLLNQGRDGIRSMREEASALGMTVSTDTAQAAEQFNDNLTRLGGQMQGLVAIITAELLPILERVSNFVVTVAQRFQELSPEMRRAISVLTLLSVAIGPIALALGTMLLLLGGPVAGLIAAFIAISAAVAAFWPQIQSAATAVVDFTTDMVRLGTDGVQFVRDKFNELIEFLTNIPAQIREAGANLMSGLAEGITGGFSNARDAISGAATGLVDRFKSDTDQRSPSRVFADLGRNLMVGLGIGIREGSEEPIADMENIAASLSGPMTGAVDAFSSAASSALKDFAKGSLDAESAVKRLGDRLLDMALDNSIQNLFAALSGGGKSGGFLGAIGAAIGGSFGGTRANGGPVTGGRTYLVGERGPELFTPGSSGGITPNSAMGGAAQITINNYSGQPVETQRGPNGRIDVTIGKQMAAALRGDPDVRRAMAQGYGLTGAG